MEQNTPITNNKRPSFQPGTAMPEAILTTRELAKLIKVSTRTVSGWIATKKVPFIKIGASVRFNGADVLAALGKYTVKEVTFKQ